MTLSRGIKIPLALAVTLVLGACFVSDEPLIPQGGAVLPIDGGLTLCVDAPDQCFDMHIEGDGYITAPDYEEGQPGRARFSPLMQVNGRQIFLLEAHDIQDDAYTYLVARRRGAEAPGDADLDLALLSCSDLDQSQQAAFEAAGGLIGSGWSAGCTAPDLDTLIATIRVVYNDKLGEDEWWAEGGGE